MVQTENLPWHAAAFIPVPYYYQFFIIAILVWRQLFVAVSWNLSSANMGMLTWPDLS
jgi:hypothetical protein